MTSSAVAEMGDRGHNAHRPKRGGCSAPFAGAGTASNTMWPRPRSTSVPSGVFIHPAVWNRHGQKIGWGGCALFLGVAGSPSNTVAWGKAYLHTKWHHSPSSRLATTGIGRKLGAVPFCPFRRDGAGSPSNTMSSRPRPTSVPSGILIHAAVWPQ